MENIILEQLKECLLDSIDRIDSGNCKLTQDGAEEVLDIFKRYTQTSRELTKTEAAEYLHISKTSFDRLVRKGVLPKGHKTKRNRILTWSTSDLDKV